MEFGIYDLLVLIGALGFFIYGMKVMSEGIQKAAGDSMRNILSAMTKNRFAGVGTGFLITGLVQSSSATTVLVISFVNAGLLSLVEATGVIMGANIGTTITAWIISLIGFKIKIAAISLPIIAFGLPMMFSKNGKIKAWAEVLIGFALLFMGLDYLKGAVPDIKHNPEILHFLARYAGNPGIMMTLFFVGVGTILTVVVQSSSAAMALTLTLCFNGVIPFHIAAAMTLGGNVGTTITAQLAALAGNVHAKRAAMVHSLFNIFGVAWFIFLLPMCLEFIDTFMSSTGQYSPLNASFQSFDGIAEGSAEYAAIEKANLIPGAAITIGLSYFHTVFNIINTLILIWFSDHIVKLAIRLVKSKSDLDEEFRLEFIGGEIMKSSELALMEAQKEISNFGRQVNKMSGIVQNYLSADNKEKEKTLNKISKYEDITDRMEEEITKYLVKVSEGTLSKKSSENLRGQLSMVHDMERMGDIFFTMGKSAEKVLTKDRDIFSPSQKSNLQRMFEKIDKAIEIMRNNLKEEGTQIKINPVYEIEEEINLLRDEIRREHLISIEKQETTLETGMAFINIISCLEKIGDHIVNVSEAIIGKKIS